MAYDFDAAFKAAFPKMPKSAPYSYEMPDGLVREVTTTELVTSSSMPATPGSRSGSRHKAIYAPLQQSVSASVENNGNTPGGGHSGRREHDPFIDANFVVEIDGISAGAFQKCDGISFECDLIEYKDGNDYRVRKRPGLRKFGNIKLTKGYITNTALWEWCDSILKGKIDRRTGAIHILKEDKTDYVVSYSFVNAFPIKWTGLKFDGKGNAASLEEIELVVEDIFKS